MMTELARSDKSFIPNYGDIFFRASDVPYSDQLAKRAEKLLPPQLQDQKGKPQIPPQVQQQLQQQQEHIQQLEGALTNASNEVEKLESKEEIEGARIRVDQEGKEVDRFKAETDRLKLIIPYMTPESLQEIAASVGLQVKDSADIYTGREPVPVIVPDESSQSEAQEPPMPPPEPMAQQQPEQNEMEGQ